MFIFAALGHKIVELFCIEEKTPEADTSGSRCLSIVWAETKILDDINDLLLIANTSQPLFEHG